MHGAPRDCHAQAVPSPVLTTSPEMHITIVAAGNHSPGFALAHEIELVKAAVLYADRVTLASPRTTMVAMVGALSGVSGRDRTEALLAMASQLPQAHTLNAAYTTLKRKRHKTKDELLALKRLECELAKAGDDLLARAAEIATEAGLNALLPAIEEGVLDLDPLGSGEGDTDVMVERMSELIQDIVAPASTTLPMFDDGSGGLLRAMVNEGAIPDARLPPKRRQTLRRGSSPGYRRSQTQILTRSWGHAARYGRHWSDTGLRSSKSPKISKHHPSTMSSRALYTNSTTTRRARIA